MRIVSLVPHATELLFALGLGPEVIAVTHECDHPPEALTLRHVTRDVLPTGLSAAEIDAAVRERTQRGEAIYELDEGALGTLEPDLIVTQALCPVCAVSYTEVAELARRMPSRPRVVSLDPHTLGETLGDVRTLAEATDRRDRGVQLIQELSARIDRVRLAVRSRPRPRVAAIEWLEPVFVAGHWTPQLIELAGGEDVLGSPGEPSVLSSWEEVRLAQPEVVVVMPCGYDAPRAHEEARAHIGGLGSVSAQRVVAVNASAYFSRPGPRLVDGLELLAHILHPELLPESPAEALTVELQAAAAPAQAPRPVGPITASEATTAPAHSTRQLARVSTSERRRSPA
jgi:iron complex transport system substrate-binding protein